MWGHEEVEWSLEAETPQVHFMEKMNQVWSTGPEPDPL